MRAVWGLAGLYVVDEANIESHGLGFEKGKTLAGRADFEAAHMSRIKVSD